jgi:hypothetical protein
MCSRQVVGWSNKQPPKSRCHPGTVSGIPSASFRPSQAVNLIFTLLAGYVDRVYRGGRGSAGHGAYDSGRARTSEAEVGSPAGGTPKADRAKAKAAKGVGVRRARYVLCTAIGTNQAPDTIERSAYCGAWSLFAPRIMYCYRIYLIHVPGVTRRRARGNSLKGTLPPLRPQYRAQTPPFSANRPSNSQVCWWPHLDMPVISPRRVGRPSQPATYSSFLEQGSV